MREYHQVLAMPESPEKQQLLAQMGREGDDIEKELLKHRGKVERRFEGYGIPNGDFLKEHKKLVYILTKGTPAKDQLKEVRQIV
jgi:hypothetical protein